MKLCDAVPDGHCPGPNCNGYLIDNRSLPDFCSVACAHAWAAVDHPTTLPIDHGAGIVKGASYSGAVTDHNNGTRPRSYAFGWLDARPEATAPADNPEPT